MARSQRAARRTTAMIIAFGIQGIVFAALVAGTAVKYIPKLNDILGARLIKPEELPPPKEPPPPPPDFVPPPVTAPPPDVITKIDAPPPVVKVVAAPPVAVVHAAPVIVPVQMEDRDKRALGEACTSYYPSASRRLNEEGSVVLVISVAPNGRATDAKVETSSGIQRLDDAAIKCMVDKGKFLPQKVDGKPVATVMRMKWTWRLQS